MSIYRHEYRAYAGRVTSKWARLGVIVRYALREAWSSRVTAVLFTLFTLPVIVCLVGIYLANNPLVRAVFMLGNSFVAIDAAFFVKVLATQCWLALVLTAWVAPLVVSHELADNALPILLSRPISRFGYVLGKFAALFTCLSLVTWIPCMMLFAYQGYTSSRPWMFANLRIAGGMLAGSILWITLLSLLGLALSSWVKWRVVATGAIFAVIFVPAGAGGIITGILRTKWGFLLNIPVMMSELWEQLLGAPLTLNPRWQLPFASILTVLLLMCCICALMLNACIRARGVVRG